MRYSYCVLHIHNIICLTFWRLAEDSIRYLKIHEHYNLSFMVYEIKRIKLKSGLDESAPKSVELQYLPEYSVIAPRLLEILRRVCHMIHSC